ncbi:MAG: hypothetical protein M3285_10970 [Actinomycetota bacterium]|nr:hypothetical protein [Actinomycetota bacterium]
MNRWALAVAAAAVTLTMSGWLSALERTTEASAALAETSAQAPRSTREAATEVSSLPEIADLTERQATAFAALADALEISSDRVSNLNDTLRAQIGGLSDLAGTMGELGSPVSCVRGRLGSLLAASAETPAALARITDRMGAILAAQNKSIRHLKSINRKLAALAAVAAARDVPPPPRPDFRPPDNPAGSAAPPRPC